MEIQEVRDLLHKDVVEVEFKKKNGDMRVMFATLLPQYLPESDSAGDGRYKDKVVTVWDLEQNAWRAFNMDSVVRVETDDMTWVKE